MKFSSAIEQLARSVAKTDTDDETKDKIKQSLNYAKIEVGKSAFWDQLLISNNELLLIPKYETGTATITKDSRTVTLGGGAIVSTSFKGRYFKSQTSINEYEVIDVDTGAGT